MLIKRLIRSAALVAAGLTLSVSLASCDDNLIFEKEGDCNPYYKVKFRYDWNLKYADAFPHEVGEVTLYLVDADGNVVWRRHEAGAEVKADGYMMDVDVAPGSYTMLAWCGEGHRTHFSIPESDEGSRLECTLLRDRDGLGNAEVAKELKGLYHGMRTQVEFPDEEGVHVIEMPLKKDTNDVTLVLQHLSGERVDPSKFRFEITSSNGLLGWDNELLPDELITYRPHTVTEGTAGIIREEDAAAGRATESMSAAVANLSVSRLVTSDDVRVSLYNVETGERVFSIPMIDYALLVKGKYGRMDDQEYLDRQDDYSMTFFLDENDRWVSAYIYINSWKVLVQHTLI